MAELYVKNSLNSNKTVRFNVSLVEYVLTDEEGDSKWTLEIGTTYPASGGGDIAPKIVHDISEDDIDAQIQMAVSELCTYIDWTTLENDNDPPRVLDTSPSGTDVLLHSQVEVVIADDIPSSGIDLSEMKVTINNGVQVFDITNDVLVLGDPFQYEIVWKPDNVVYSRYE